MSENKLKFRKFNVKRSEKELKRRLPGLQRQLAALEKAGTVSRETMRLVITI